MFWFCEFAGVYLPPVDFSTAIPREFDQARIAGTGSDGEFDLNGLRNRMGQQTYTHEITVMACDFQTKLDELMGCSRRAGILKKTNGTITRRTTSRTKISNITDATTIADWKRGDKRIAMQFTAEPLWYDDQVDYMTFSSATLILPENLGNARAIQGVEMTIYTGVGSPLVINTYPQGDGTLYDEGVYDTFYYEGTDLGNEVGTLSFTIATGTTIYIDAGNSRITLGGIDCYDKITLPPTQMALLWLEPGVNQITFSSPVTGLLVWRNAWI